MTAPDIAVVFTPYRDFYWGTWADPTIVIVGTTVPLATVADNNQAGRALAIERITEALAHGRAERVR